MEDINVNSPSYICGKEEGYNLAMAKVKDCLERKKAYYREKYTQSMDALEQTLWGAKEDAMELCILEFFGE